MRTAILIPGTVGPFRVLHIISRAVAQKTGVKVTVKIKEVLFLLKRKRLDRVVILTGSKDKKILNAYQTYRRLHRANKNADLIIIDSNTWPVKSIIIPGEENIIKIILGAVLSNKEVIVH